MPCLLFVFGAGFPRLVLVVLYFFSAWFAGVYPNILVPIAGLIFAPLSTVWYAVVQHYYGGAWTLWPLVGMVLAVAIDFGVIGGGARERARR